MRIGSPENNSFIANCPDDFDLDNSILSAKEVRIATAFAHQTGWKLLKGALKSTPAEVYLLAGIDFCQTEPSVLEDWISEDFVHASTYIYHGKAVFHPKIIIVSNSTSGKSFVILGSGNMSKGGFVTNIECNIYIDDVKQVNELISWYEAMLKNPKETINITAKFIEYYKPKYEKSRKLNAKANAVQIEAKNSIAAQVSRQATMVGWNEAIDDARKYFQTKVFEKEMYENHKQAVSKIKRTLNSPQFNFTYDQWSNFYDIWELGHLIPVSKVSIFTQEKKLKRGLKQLIDDDNPVSERMDYIIDNSRSTGVKGININTASKILTAHNHKKWPVRNGPVDGVLKYYGYKDPRGLTVGEKYEAFANLMEEFIKQTGAQDMLALDCFFYEKNKQI